MQMLQHITYKIHNVTSNQKNIRHVKKQKKNLSEQTDAEIKHMKELVDRNVNRYTPYTHEGGRDIKDKTGRYKKYSK